MTAAAKPTTLAEALVAAQAKMPAVKADARAEVPTKSGGKYTYDYVTLDHLVALTRPILNEHGLAIVQTVAVLDTGQPVLRTTILHTSGETFVAGEMPLFSEKAMQPFGGAITYARRYSWAAALGICDQGDDDAAAATKPSAAARNGAHKPTPKEELLTNLVKERGGDVPALLAAIAKMRMQPDYQEWLKFQTNHWQQQPVQVAA